MICVWAQEVGGIAAYGFGVDSSNTWEWKGDHIKLSCAHVVCTRFGRCSFDIEVLTELPLLKGCKLCCSLCHFRSSSGP